MGEEIDGEGGVRERRGGVIGKRYRCKRRKGGKNSHRTEHEEEKVMRIPDMTPLTEPEIFQPPLPEITMPHEHEPAHREEPRSPERIER